MASGESVIVTNQVKHHLCILGKQRMTRRIIRPSREPRLAHQIEARQSTKRMILQSGALGSGKTMNMARWMLERVIGMPGSVGAAGAGNYRQTEVTIKAEFDQALDDLPEIKACLEVRGVS